MDALTAEFELDKTLNQKEKVSFSDDKIYVVLKVSNTNDKDVFIFTDRVNHPKFCSNWSIYGDDGEKGVKMTGSKRIAKDVFQKSPKKKFKCLGAHKTTKISFELKAVLLAYDFDESGKKVDIGYDGSVEYCLDVDAKTRVIGKIRIKSGNIEIPLK